MVDYDNLPIRCKVCLSWKQRVRDCEETSKKSWIGARKSPHVENPHPQGKGKGIAVDQDGFQ